MNRPWFGAEFCMGPAVLVFGEELQVVARAVVGFHVLAFSCLVLLKVAAFVAASP